MGFFVFVLGPATPSGVQNVNILKKNINKMLCTIWDRGLQRRHEGGDLPQGKEKRKATTKEIVRYFV